MQTTIIPAEMGYWSIYEYGEGGGFYQNPVIAWVVSYDMPSQQTGYTAPVYAVPVCAGAVCGNCESMWRGLLFPDGRVDTLECTFDSYDAFLDEMKKR